MIDEPRLLAVEAEYVLYYIAQEALFNAYKHVQAESVTITMRFTISAVQLVVGDDLGTEPMESTMAHFGLRNVMRKLNVNHRTEAVYAASKLGLL